MYVNPKWRSFEFGANCHLHWSSDQIRPPTRFQTLCRRVRLKFRRALKEKFNMEIGKLLTLPSWIWNYERVMSRIFRSSSSPGTVDLIWNKILMPLMMKSLWHLWRKMDSWEWENIKKDIFHQFQLTIT